MEDFKQEGVVLVGNTHAMEANRRSIKKRLFLETVDKIPFELFLACNDQFLPMKKRRLYHNNHQQITSFVIKKKPSLKPKRVSRGPNKKNGRKIPRSKPDLPKAKKPSIKLVFRGGNKKSAVDNIPQSKPDLPEGFYKKIAELRQGTNRVDDPVLVIQKKLYQTDIAPGQNRFSIPKNQMLCEFLTNEENKFLCGRVVDGHKNAIEVRIIEPLVRVGRVKLTKWNYREEKNMSYVLNGTWNDIVRNYGLKPGMTVQVWAFRVEEELCLALVKLS